MSVRFEPWISFILPVHNQPQILERHAEQVRAIAPNLRPRLEWLLIDNHSDPSLQWKQHPCDRLFRVVGEPIEWSSPGCRNFGASVAQGSWLFFTDADHVVPADVWEQLLPTIDLMTPAVYLFRRRKVLGLTTKPVHQNTFLIPKVWFLERLGGYDEDFLGHYGHDDDFFHFCRAQAAMPLKTLELVLDHYEGWEDADYTRRTDGWSRDHGRNQALLRRKQAEFGKHTLPLQNTHTIRCRCLTPSCPGGRCAR